MRKQVTFNALDGSQFEITFEYESGVISNVEIYQKRIDMFLEMTSKNTFESLKSPHKFNLKQIGNNLYIEETTATTVASINL